MDEKNFGRKIFWSKIFLLQNNFLGKSLDEKILVEKFFGRNVFCSKIFLLQFHFLGNSLDEKYLVEKLSILLNIMFLHRWEDFS